jgi:hypothetical protein
VGENQQQPVKETRMPSETAPPSVEELHTYAAQCRALAAFRRAQADLYDSTAREAEARITVETPEYEQLNQAVIDAAEKLPEGLKYLAEGL